MKIQAGENPDKDFFKSLLTIILKGEGPSRTKIPRRRNKNIIYK